MSERDGYVLCGACEQMDCASDIALQAMELLRRCRKLWIAPRDHAALGNLRVEIDEFLHSTESFPDGEGDEEGDE